MLDDLCPFTVAAIKDGDEWIVSVDPKEGGRGPDRIWMGAALAFDVTRPDDENLVQE